MKYLYIISLVLFNLSAFSQDCESKLMPDSLLLSSELVQTEWIDYAKNNRFGLRLTQEKNTPKIKLSLRSLGENFVKKGQEVTFLFSNDSKLTITFENYHFEHVASIRPKVSDDVSMTGIVSVYMFRNFQYISKDELQLFKNYNIIEVKHNIKPKKRKKVNPLFAIEVKKLAQCFINKMK